jgi:hypothetical protein
VRELTVHVSFVGFVSVFVTTQVLADRPDELTVYLVIVAPFVIDPVHDTVAFPVPLSAVGLPGADGEPALTPVEAADAGDVPLAFVAFTVKVYVVPFVSVPTVQESGPADHV